MKRFSINAKKLGAMTRISQKIYWMRGVTFVRCKGNKRRPGMLKGQGKGAALSSYRRARRGTHEKVPYSPYLKEGSADRLEYTAERGKRMRSPEELGREREKSRSFPSPFCNLRKIRLRTEKGRSQRYLKRKGSAEVEEVCRAKKQGRARYIGWKRPPKGVGQKREKKPECPWV